MHCLRSIKIIKWSPQFPFLFRRGTVEINRPIFFHKHFLQIRHTAGFSPQAVWIHGHSLWVLLCDGERDSVVQQLLLFTKLIISLKCMQEPNRRLVIDMCDMGVSSPFNGKTPPLTPFDLQYGYIRVFEKSYNVPFSLYAKLNLIHGISPAKYSLNRFHDPRHNRHYERQGNIELDSNLKQVIIELESRTTTRIMT